MNNPARPEAGQQPSVSVLDDLLRYDCQTGKLYWRLRPRHYFAGKTSAGIWNNRYAGREAFTAIGTHGYRRGRIFDRAYGAHRIAWAIFYGKWPDGNIDHINGDPSDNSIMNLRVVDAVENARNSKIPAHNTSGTIGVSWHKRCRKWAAHITLHQKKKHLGLFIEKSDAIAARMSANLTFGFHKNHGRCV